jgi:hypothetical protein
VPVAKAFAHRGQYKFSAISDNYELRPRNVSGQFNRLDRITGFFNRDGGIKGIIRFYPPIPFIPVNFLIDIDDIADKPQIKLFKPVLPTSLIFTHPLTASFVVRNVNYYLGKIISVQNALMPPMSFNLLRLIARRIESFYNL